MNSSKASSRASKTTSGSPAPKQKATPKGKPKTEVSRPPKAPTTSKVGAPKANPKSRASTELSTALPKAKAATDRSFGSAVTVLSSGSAAAKPSVPSAAVVKSANSGATLRATGGSVGSATAKLPSPAAGAKESAGSRSPLAKRSGAASKSSAGAAAKPPTRPAIGLASSKSAPKSTASASASKASPGKGAVAAKPTSPKAPGRPQRLDFAGARSAGSMASVQSTGSPRRLTGAESRATGGSPSVLSARGGATAKHRLNQLDSASVLSHITGAAAPSGAKAAEAVQRRDSAGATSSVSGVTSRSASPPQPLTRAKVRAIRDSPRMQEAGSSTAPSIVANPSLLQIDSASAVGDAASANAPPEGKSLEEKRQVDSATAASDLGNVSDRGASPSQHLVGATAAALQDPSSALAAGHSSSPPVTARAQLQQLDFASAVSTAVNTRASLLTQVPAVPERCGSDGTLDVADGENRRSASPPKSPENAQARTGHGLQPYEQGVANGAAESSVLLTDEREVETSYSSPITQKETNGLQPRRSTFLLVDECGNPITQKPSATESNHGTDCVADTTTPPMTAAAEDQRAGGDQSPMIALTEDHHTGDEQFSFTEVEDGNHVGGGQLPLTTTEEDPGAGSCQLPLTTIEEDLEAGSGQSPLTTTQEIPEAGSDQLPLTTIEEDPQTGSGQSPLTTIEERLEAGSDQLPLTTMEEDPEAGSGQLPLTTIEENPKTGSGQPPLTTIEEGPETGSDQLPLTTIEEDPELGSGESPLTTIEERPAAGSDQLPLTTMEEDPEAGSGQVPLTTIEENPEAGSGQLPLSTVEEDSEAGRGQLPLTTIEEDPQAGSGQLPLTTTEERLEAVSDQLPLTTIEEDPKGGSGQSPLTTIEEGPEAGSGQSPLTTIEEGPEAGSGQLPLTATEERPPAGSDQLPLTTIEERPAAGSDQLPLSTIAEDFEACSDQLPLTTIEEDREAGGGQSPLTTIEERLEAGSDQLPLTTMEEDPEAGSDQLPLSTIEEDPEAGRGLSFLATIEEDPEASRDQLPLTTIEQGCDAGIDQSLASRTEEGRDARGDKSLVNLAVTGRDAEHHKDSVSVGMNVDPVLSGERPRASIHKGRTSSFCCTRQSHFEQETAGEEKEEHATRSLPSGEEEERATRSQLSAASRCVVHDTQYSLSGSSSAKTSRTHGSIRTGGLASKPPAAVLTSDMSSRRRVLAGTVDVPESHSQKVFPLHELQDHGPHVSTNDVPCGLSPTRSVKFDCEGSFWASQRSPRTANQASTAKWTRDGESRSRAVSLKTDSFVSELDSPTSRSPYSKLTGVGTMEFFIGDTDDVEADHDTPLVAAFTGPNVIAWARANGVDEDVIHALEDNAIDGETFGSLTNDNEIVLNVLGLNEKCKQKMLDAARAFRQDCCSCMNLVPLLCNSEKLAEDVGAVVSKDAFMERIAQIGAAEERGSQKIVLPPEKIWRIIAGTDETIPFKDFSRMMARYSEVLGGAGTQPSGSTEDRVDQLLSHVERLNDMLDHVLLEEHSPGASGITSSPRRASQKSLPISETLSSSVHEDTMSMNSQGTANPFKLNSQQLLERQQQRKTEADFNILSQKMADIMDMMGDIGGEEEEMENELEDDKSYASLDNFERGGLTNPGSAMLNPAEENQLKIESIRNNVRMSLRKISWFKASARAEELSPESVKRLSEVEHWSHQLKEKVSDSHFMCKKLWSTTLSSNGRLRRSKSGSLFSFRNSLPQRFEGPGQTITHADFFEKLKNARKAIEAADKIARAVAEKAAHHQDEGVTRKQSGSASIPLQRVSSAHGAETLADSAEPEDPPTENPSSLADRLSKYDSQGTVQGDILHAPKGIRLSFLARHELSSKEFSPKHVGTNTSQSLLQAVSSQVPVDVPNRPPASSVLAEHRRMRFIVSRDQRVHVNWDMLAGKGGVSRVSHVPVVAYPRTTPVQGIATVDPKRQAIIPPPSVTDSSLAKQLLQGMQGNTPRIVDLKYAPHRA